MAMAMTMRLLIKTNSTLLSQQAIILMCIHSIIIVLILDIFTQQQPFLIHKFNSHFSLIN